MSNISVSDSETDSVSSIHSNDEDPSYEITNEDRRIELSDKADDLPRSKRARTQTNRLGVEKGTGHNTFFENLLSQQASIDSAPEKSNGIVVHATTDGEKAPPRSNNSSIHDLLQILMVKINSIEDYLIKLDIKLDNLATDGLAVQTSNRKVSSEIDISILKPLGLPARSSKELIQLENNLEKSAFREKLVSPYNSIQIVYTLKFCFQSHDNI